MQQGSLERRSDAGQPLDALGAQSLVDVPPGLHHLHLLQVRAEGTARGPHREAARVSERRRLAALCTTSHWNGFLSEQSGSGRAGGSLPQVAMTHQPVFSSLEATIYEPSAPPCRSHRDLAQGHRHLGGAGRPAILRRGRHGVAQPGRRHRLPAGRAIRATAWRSTPSDGQVEHRSLHRRGVRHARVVGGRQRRPTPCATRSSAPWACRSATSTSTCRTFVSATSTEIGERGR